MTFLFTKRVGYTTVLHQTALHTAKKASLRISLPTYFLLSDNYPGLYMTFILLLHKYFASVHNLTDSKLLSWQCERSSAFSAFCFYQLTSV